MIKIEKPESLIPARKPGTPLFKDVLVKAIREVKVLEEDTGKPISVSADKAGNIRISSEIDSFQFENAVEKAVEAYVKSIFNIK